MMKKDLLSLLQNVDVLEIRGLENPEIQGLAYDSRDVKTGYIFFALKGLHTDGHNYIEAAVKQGAVAIIYSDEPTTYNPDITYVRVGDSRFVMAPVSSAFYGNPSEKMKVIGVTGTNGKSTTVLMIYQLLNMAGLKAGFISTVSFDTGSGPVKNHYRQSTPEATEIQKLLYEMHQRGCTHVVIEATSHGLSKINNRLGNVNFDGAVFTNISHEHLEFHKTLDRYIDDKANLFRSLQSESGFGIVNSDDPYESRFAEAANGKVFSYSKNGKDTDMAAVNIKGTSSSVFYTLVYEGNEYGIKMNLPSIFNVENSLAALLGTVKLTGKPVETFIPSMPKLIPAEGRMITVDLGQEFTVIVDYAHSPGSFELLFPALREMAKGSLISVFGSAGERDIDKRAEQGRIASEYCDILFLTDEDPREEDSMDIIRDIASGCPERIPDRDMFLIADREEAIGQAFRSARKDDLVVLLGKGHESTIIYKEGAIPWNEKEKAVSILKGMGYNNETT